MTDGPLSSFELRSRQAIRWVGEAPEGVALDRVYLGADLYGSGLQIALARSETRPTRSVLRTLWEGRAGKRAVDVAIAVTYGSQVSVFGPDPDVAPIEGLPVDQAARVLQAILDEPTALAAWDRFGDLHHAVTTTGVRGFINSGLFASHHLRENVPARADWAAFQAEAQPLLPLRGRALIESLGFAVQERGGVLLLSGAGPVPRAVAVLLDEADTFEGDSAKYQLSPVAFGLREAVSNGVDWLVALKAGRLRLYAGKTGVGVGQKGQSETYFEIDLASVDDGHAALLPLIFGAAALEPNGTTQQILEESGRYATGLGTRLRDRIYKDVVPPLARAVAEHLPRMGLQVDEEGLRTAYRVTLRILFRLLFQAYAEDRGLLPAGRSERYDANSLQSAAQRDLHTDPASFGSAATLWADLEQVWDAIDLGNEQWMVPPYNGGLFSRAEGEGALIARLRLPDSVMGPVLQALLVDLSGEDGFRGPVDFQSLSVREFGTIYEGLLESSLSLAESDLTIDPAKAYVPAREGDVVEIPAGSAYFHNSSGERKATGSYFTPKIVVDHLIERSIVPVLNAHLAKIEALLADGKDVEAGRSFFDFRVADLAMGSGHFLVAAVDRVEAMYRDFLTRHDVPRVREELLRVEQAAKSALRRDVVAKRQVEPIVLLRRQVARRCIYGIDVNPLALELSRLALWIHTFVPGLPMSSFDHNLVCANSLTGIGTVEEALDALVPGRQTGQASFVDAAIAEALAAAAPLFVDAANADEADKGGLDKGAALRAAAREKLEPIRRVFDLAVAVRTRQVQPLVAFDLAALEGAALTTKVSDAVEQLDPAHMPYLFPEVFQRPNPGFDVLLGNPPWEKIKVETDQWWGLRIPRLRSLPQAQKNAVITEARQARPDLEAEFLREVAAADAARAVVVKGPFPGIGSGGDPDLYQAFAWRYWQLVRAGGRTGFVVPRGATSGAALQPWRRAVLAEGSFADVCFITNTGNWVFAGVDGRYTVALTVIERGDDRIVRFSGPFASEREFIAGSTAVASVEAGEFGSWSSTAAFPFLPDPKSSEVFGVLMQAVPFGEERAGWAFRPFRELDATNDKHLLEFDLATRGNRIPIMAGASFNLWNPDFADPYAYSQTDLLRRHLLNKLARAVHTRRSAYFGATFGPGELPLDRPRIAFRDIARSTDSRTVIAALIPPGTSATHKAPVLVRRLGGADADAFLLGVMSSRAFDWASRRWVELNLTYEILNGLPVPVRGINARSDRVVEVAGRLAAVDERYQEWADEVGVPVGSVTDAVEKQDLVDELDAIVSLLYGLSADQVEHIYATFHRGWNYAPRLAAVLQHFHAWGARA